MRRCVLLFARAKDLAGTSSVTLDLPAGATVAELRRRLAEDNPALAPLLQHSALAVNGEFAHEEGVVPAGAEIALLPPVSGGSL
jgi:molybdopterin converting factor subunit 1